MTASMPMVEHDPTGAIRYFIASEAAPIETHRPIPTVAEAIRSIGDDQWAVAPVACLGCVFGWVAIVPVPRHHAGAADEVVNYRLARLECPKCGARRAATIEDCWCSACGNEHRTAREPGCPAEGMQCPACNKMAAMVA